MKRTEITVKELNKKVKKFKAKLMRGKTIALSMLITCAVMLIICAIMVAMGITGEENVFTYSLYIVLGSTAALCIYPGLYALIRLPYIIKFFKRIKVYESNDILREMVFDLQTSEPVNFGDKAILSDKYLFTKNFKKLPIPCSEIYWVYTLSYKGYTSIKLGTKNDGIVSYSGVESHDRRFKLILENAFQELQNRTDTELLFGNTMENKAKYNEWVGKNKSIP